MNIITKEMILECYEAFKTNNFDVVPKGMNPTSAKMTMCWLNSILKTKQLYNRSASLLQCRIILEKIKQDFGIQKAKEAALALLPYYEKYDRQQHLTILNRFISV